MPNERTGITSTKLKGMDDSGSYGSADPYSKAAGDDHWFADATDFDDQPVEDFDWWNDFNARAVFVIGCMTTALTLLEFVYAMLTGSLTLVADAFHRLSDVMTMVCTFYAIILSHRPQTSKMSYGYKRAEVLGGLCNAVFLLALCFFMCEKIIKSFIDPPTVSRPLEIAIVGAVGMVVCILGLFMFNGAGHTHAGGEKCTGHGEGDAGHSHASAGHSHGDKPCGGHGAPAPAPTGGHSHGDKPCGGHGAPAPKPAGGHGHGHGAKPAAAPAAAGGHSHGSKPCTGHGSGSGFGTGAGKGYQQVDQDDEDQESLTTGGVSDNVNIWQLYLHLVGDVLGALFIIAEGLIVYLVDAKWTDYLDPAFSLVIVLIILCTTIPIVTKTVDTLYQSVPDEIDLGKINRKLRALDGVNGVHELHAWRLVNDVVIGTAHVRTSYDGAEQGRLLTAIKKVFHQQQVHSLTIQLEYEDAHTAIPNRGARKSVCVQACVPDCSATRCCD
eukprot:TRINITY_DN950_c0_g1_i3.p1 TRINITY_DN950_c0_g1~~TRINITY_DN950_c0_g1_i3.p1  ORF type:complete len:497 (-),score=108.17 TRINITY_DN950_c0_g1_i3:247-1737(-)